jgi:hypothetical protein
MFATGFGLSAGVGGFALAAPNLALVSLRNVIILYLN